MKILLLLAFVVFSNVASAKGFIQWGKIDAIAFQNGDVMLYGNFGNPNQCQQANAVILKHTDTNFDKAYSLILAAYMSGKEVRSYSDGCHVFDGSTYNYIRGFKYLTVR